MQSCLNSTLLYSLGSYTRGYVRLATELSLVARYRPGTLDCSEHVALLSPLIILLLVP